MQTVVLRHINDITINPMEFLLDEQGDVMRFDNKAMAVKFLKDAGVSDSYIEWLTFRRIKEKQNEENMPALQVV